MTYYCGDCDVHFEVNFSDPDYEVNSCPHCASMDIEKD